MDHKITKEMFKGTMIVMIIAELSGALTALIDGVITSRFLGPVMMSAQGIASAYFPVTSIIDGVLMVGCQALAVEAISKGLKEKARNIITMASYTGIFLSLLVSIIIWIAPDAVAILFGATPTDSLMVKSVGDYLKGIAVGSVGILLFIVLTPIVQLDGGGRYCTIASITMGIVDVLGDIVFGIFLKMGLFGMGLASGLSHLAACLVLLIFMFSKKCSLKFNFKTPEFKSLGRVFVNGLPRALAMIGRSVGPILLNIIVLNITINGVTSSIGMSALAVQRSLQFAVASIGWGISGALLMLGTLYYNERNYSEFRMTLLITIRNIVILVCGLSIVLYAASPFIARLFTTDYLENQELYNTTLIAIKYYFISLPFVAFNVSFANYAQATGKNILANVLNVCIEFLALVLACYLLSINHGYNEFFLGLFVGEAILSVICVACFTINYFIQRNRYKKLMLPHDFINENTLVIEKAVRSVEEALAFSSSIMYLCKDTELDETQIYRLSLCVEEMSVNVFKHGFTKDNKKHVVMVRIVIEGKKVVLTVLDDCKEFDITKKLKTWEIDPEHPEKYIGIRVIMSLAKEVRYTNTMNINNLQIIL